MKKVITESQLRRIVKESIKKVLREGGNIYWKDEDGTPHTNSRETYRGVPGTIYVWHGEWADPTIIYKNQEINVNDIDNLLWSDYKEACEEYGDLPTDAGFEDWLEGVGAVWIQERLDDIIAGMQ